MDQQEEGKPETLLSRRTSSSMKKKWQAIRILPAKAVCQLKKLNAGRKLR